MVASIDFRILCTYVSDYFKVRKKSQNKVHLLIQRVAASDCTLSALAFTELVVALLMTTSTWTQSL